MSAELEARLKEVFAAQAATTTTSDDAWARIHRRAEKHDHRRSVVLRSVAAAVIAVLVVGGGVALFRDGDESGTVATGGSASKSVAADSAESSTGGVGGAPVAPTVEPGADGDVVVLGGLRFETNNRGVSLPAPIQGTASDGIVLGTVRKDAATVSITPSAGPVELFDDPSLPLLRIFVARQAPRGATTFAVEARDASGQVIADGGFNGG
jgi:hypothetical protein